MSARVLVALAGALLLGCGGSAPTGASPAPPPPRTSAPSASAAPAPSASAPPATPGDAASATPPAPWWAGRDLPPPELVVAHPPKGPSKPVVRETQMLDPAAFAAMLIRRHHRAVATCYASARAATPKLEGRLVLSLTAHDDRVQSVEVVADWSTLEDEALRRCVQAELLGAALPVPGTTRVLWRYEFLLEPPAGPGVVR